MENLEDSLRLLLDENRKSLITKAKLVKRELPDKILMLDKVLEQSLNQSLCVLEVGHHHHHHEEQGNNRSRKPRKPSRKPLRPVQQPQEESSCFACMNSVVERAVGVVKSYIQQLNTDANLLKMCIASLPPKAAVMSEAKTIKATLNDDIHETCDRLMKKIAEFFKNRSNAVLMACHHQASTGMSPEEFRNEVVTIDENMFLSMRSAVADIRNHYSVLHGLLAQHFDNIMSQAGQSDHQ